MRRLRVASILVLACLFLAGLVLGPALFDAAANALAPGTAYASAFEQEDPFAPAEGEARQRYICNLRSVITSSDGGFGIQCWNAPSNLASVTYFGTPANPADDWAVDRLTSTALTAHALGRPVEVGFEAATSGNYGGCPTSVCRRVIDIRMQ